MRKITGRMKVMRSFFVPTAYDAAGHVADGHHEEEEFEVDLEGDYLPAEPDVGLMGPGAENITAARTDTGEAIELTEEEDEQAALVLGEGAQDYGADDYDIDRP